MWRGPTVQAQKDKNAKAKAKINTLHAKLITLAAAKWSDPHLNRSLADVIATAKKDGVTTDVIDRAIRRGAWLDKDSTLVEEILYEGFAPGGVGIIVRALTDNRNRTAPNMRHIFSAFWWNLWETWTVSNFAFDYRGVIYVSGVDDMDIFESQILETPADDYHRDGNQVSILTGKSEFIQTRSMLESFWYHIDKAGFEFLPKNYIEVTDFENALKIYKMLDEFSEDEDVEIVWNNADISDELWREVESFVESKKFRT